ARFESVGQRADALAVLLVPGEEEVVVVEDEDVDAAGALLFHHLVGDRFDVTESVALSRQRLLVPGGDAAERTVRIAASAPDERRDAVAEASGGRSASIGRRKAREIGQRRGRRPIGHAVAITQRQA